VAQQPNSAPVRRIVEVSGSHRHTEPVGFLSTSDQLLAQAATYKTHNKHKRRTTMASAGFEPTIPETKRLENYALDRMTRWSGLKIALIILKLILKK